MPLTDSIEGKVFLHIVAMAILDLRHRDTAQAEKFISDLQFQAEHIINLIPESRRHLSGDIDNFVPSLLAIKKSLENELNKMTPGERLQSARRREVWRQFYGLLNEGEDA